MTEQRPPATMDVRAAIGGVRGFIDSTIPPLVFVLVRVVTHELQAAITAAIVTGAVILGLRLSRKEPVQQAVTGFFGVAIAAAVSGATGTGKGFFLPGILMVGFTAVGSLISILAKRPFVGWVLASFDKRYADWRTDPALYRACYISSIVWCASFFLRTGVATYVYNLDGDRDGLMLVVINLVKLPSMAIAAWVTYLLVKAATPPKVADPDPTAPTSV